ncbi:hypothetical protein [Gracilinema caldarium]|jgi:hypothetical protein|uniref:hypothetical protein n=1 Tax=Gracilinema caldarium TaxID=215591 RepID=UPI0016A0BEE2|nr:hypothetical protein [Gracilinema caldarium]NLJ10219.1 hypothetical protein [Treponema sp.]
MRTNTNLFLYVISMYLLLVVSFNLSAETPSDENPVYQVNNKALGFQVGSLSGVGLSYHQWFGSNGLQITGGVLPSYGSEISYNIGVEYQRIVFGSNANDWLSGVLYIYGAGFHGGRVDSNTGAYSPSFGIGAGIGIEIILFEHFSIPIGLVNGVGITPWDPYNKFEFILMPQAGFRYRYN